MLPSVPLLMRRRELRARMGFGGSSKLPTSVAGWRGGKLWSFRSRLAERSAIPSCDRQRFGTSRPPQLRQQ